MVRNHFSKAHRVELKRIFTELADEVHERGVKQIVGCGPSATPYARALARAVKNRHGISVDVVPLGSVAERISDNSHAAGSRGIIDGVKALINNRKKRFLLDKPRESLLLEDVVRVGRRFEHISTVMTALRVPHSTASILRVVSGGESEPVYYVPNYVGKQVRLDDSLHTKVFLKRGSAFEGRSMQKTVRPPRKWLHFITKVQNELREIADSVPKLEK